MLRCGRAIVVILARMSTRNCRSFTRMRRVQLFATQTSERFCLRAIARSVVDLGRRSGQAATMLCVMRIRRPNIDTHFFQASIDLARVNCTWHLLLFFLRATTNCTAFLRAIAFQHTTNTTSANTAQISLIASTQSTFFLNL